MKKCCSTIFVTVGALTFSASASSLILADNFNAPNTGNFDNSDQTGRRSGLAGADIQLRSSRRQHGIIDNQLDLARPGGGSGRVRFHDANSLSDWHDWSSGAAGALITTDGGFRVEFDWTPANNTDTNWVSWSVGFSQGPEPGIRLNNAETDFGILFRNNGGTERFDNSAAGVTGTPFTATTISRHVTLEYTFTSWADGSDVSVNAWVDGTDVIPGGYDFSWDNNLGGVSFELGSNVASGTRIDNF
ncbi:hypothetical protein N9Y81_03200, partial [Akkermansiaceae bacterium]|nr:hypothetical protein [Akkermansiaceae bacterium]